MSQKKITLHDMTLRDGMHPKRHLMTLDQMKSIACGLDAAGVPLIEVTHGDGLGGSSVNYGFPAHSDEEYLGTVIPLMKQAKVSALLLPGIGTVDHLKMAHGLGVHTIRVATHCTEADVSEQHITYARKLDMDTVGFLMMAHMNSPEGLVTQAKLMEGYGANCIYITDSAGYMLPGDVKVRLQAVRDALKPETELGFHGHHNLAMGVANSVAAIECGATRIDAAAAGLGRLQRGVTGARLPPLGTLTGSTGRRPSISNRQARCGWPPYIMATRSSAPIRREGGHRSSIPLRPPIISAYRPASSSGCARRPQSSPKRLKWSHTTTARPTSSASLTKPQ